MELLDLKPLGLLLTLCFVVFTQRTLQGQEDFFGRLKMESRMLSPFDAGELFGSTGAFGFTYSHVLGESMRRHMFIYSLLVPVQYVSNFSRNETSFRATSLGTMLKLEIGKGRGECKWNLSGGLGKELYFNQLASTRFTSAAVLMQIGLRYLNDESFFRDFEIGFTNSAFTLNRSKSDMQNLAGVYVRLGIL